MVSGSDDMQRTLSDPTEVVASTMRSCASMNKPITIFITCPGVKSASLPGSLLAFRVFCVYN